MNQDDKLRGRIESYLDGLLNHEEEKDFEQQLANDSEFKNEFENIKATRQLLDLYNRMELKKMLESYAAEHTEESDQPEKVIPFRFKFHWYQAAATLLIFFMVSYFYTAKNYNNEAIAVSQFEPRAANFSVRRGANKHITSKLDQGLMAYEEENYPEAIDILNTIPSENQEKYFQAQFYLGSSYLAVRKSTLAIKSFILAKGYSNEEARKWYLGLAYLANDEEDSARKLFQTLIDINSHRYKNTSISVLEKLDSKLRLLPGIV